MFVLQVSLFEKHISTENRKIISTQNIFILSFKPRKLRTLVKGFLEFDVFIKKKRTLFKILGDVNPTLFQNNDKNIYFFEMMLRKKGRNLSEKQR